MASVPPAENIPENEIDKEDDLNVEKKEKASESPELETHLERKKEAAAVM